MTKNKIGIITMGCPKNLVDSEKLAALLADEGFTVEHEQSDADIWKGGRQNGTAAGGVKYFV